ncbi:MAG: flagellin lysine-N-methylase [Oscillospiraceae bacterium]|nr:flagellin lysine-N-methylase [Oscillospiraceae bacterium]
MKIREQSCYADFVCIAGDCPDTCCRSWEVVIDEKTKAYYETLPGELGDYVRSCLITDEEGDTCMKPKDGACPMLLESGLCLLQKELGEQALSRVCDRYPRFTHSFGALTERGISLSCPVACEMILYEPFLLTERTNNDPPDLNDLDPDGFFALLQGRQIAFRIAEDARFTVRQRMALLLRFAEELEDSLWDAEEVLQNWSNADLLPETLAALQPSRRSDFGKLTALWQQMEPLTERYPQLLRRLQKPLPLPDEAMEQRLLQYFLYRYFLQAAYDGKLLKKVQLAAASLLLCGAIFAAEHPNTREEEVDLIHLFSRELEHSEPNLAVFYRWAGRRRQYLLRSLLLLS